MKTALSLLLLFLALTPGQSQTAEHEKQQNRLAVATDWLHRLCVVPNGEFQSVDPKTLVAAFERWTNQPQTGGPCDPTMAVPPDKAKRPISVDLSSLRLSAWEQIARIPQFRAQVQQTPDYVYGVLQGAPTGTANQFFPNPDHGLLSLGGPVHFDEIYVGADTRVAICSVVDELNAQAKKIDAHATPLSDSHCKDASYLLANRPRDNLARIGSAIALDINFSQVPKYQAPIIISSFDGLNYPYWSKTITGSFDASKLFRSSAELRGLLGYSSKVDASNPLSNRDTVLHDLCDHRLDQLQDPGATDDCVKAITIGNIPKRLAISVLPRIDVKATSPFDLSKYGSSFVAPPNRAGRSIYSVTFNWDLRNLIPATKDRLDAFTALKTLNDPPKPPAEPNQAQTKEVAWRQQVSALYEELRRTPEASTEPEWWTRFQNIMLRSQ